VSLPDGYLEAPPDHEWCEEHGQSKPCEACLADEADRRYDSQKERRS
jgi:hypothetical protein